MQRAAFAFGRNVQRRLVAGLAGRPLEPLSNQRPREMIATPLCGTQNSAYRSLERGHLAANAPVVGQWLMTGVFI